MNNALISSAGIGIGSQEDYFSAISRIPRLDAEEERGLAERFRREGDLEAARQLVLANLRFVAYIARGYMGYGLPFADLVQEGNIGLMKAVKRYDPDQGVRLVSFAVHWIRAEIHEFILHNWRIVKVATTKAQRKLFFNLRKMKTHVGWLTAGEAEQVAQELGVAVGDVHEMERRLNQQDTALESHADDSDADVMSPIDYLNQEGDDPETLLADREWEMSRQDQLKKAMASLDERSRDIVFRRWLSPDKATLHDLADSYQVSAERIRQLESGAMKKLKAAMAA